MSLFVRILNLSVVLTLALGGCSSIETRGIAKCSGQHRRPMNADLWQWQERNPVSYSQTEQVPMNFTAIPEKSKPVTAIDKILEQEKKPQWNIEASLSSCQ